MCVKWCLVDALTYEEREEDAEEETGAEQEELDVGLEALADKYGMDKIQDAIARMNKKDIADKRE